MTTMQPTQLISLSVRSVYNCIVSLVSCPSKYPTNCRLFLVSKGPNQDSVATVFANWAALTDQTRVPFSSITKEQLLGHGRFGDVVQGGLMTSNSTSRQPILLRFLAAKQEDLMVEFKRQLDVFHRVKHVNLAAVLGHCQDAEQFCLIIEALEEQVTLKSYLLSSEEAMSSDCLYSLTLQIARGMTALAKASLVHRDLGTRNILVSSKEKGKVSGFCNSFNPQFFLIIDQF